MHFGITLHTIRPYNEWSQEELITTASIFALLDRMASVDLCLVYDRTADGAYTTRSFTSKGRPLPVLDSEMTPAVLMPASELDAFLRLSPEPGPGNDQ